MKGQRILPNRQLSDELKIAAEGVSDDYSINSNADDAVYEASHYVQLSDSSKKARFRAKSVLDTLTALGISTEILRQAGVIEQPLKVLLVKELSWSRYFRWAVLDNLVEKVLQGLILNKQDISHEAINFCIGMSRQVPSGRSLLIHQASGLKKMYGARGLVLTTEMALTKAIKISIAAFLSYRLYASLQMGDNSNFLELTAIFEDNSKKGLKSLVYFLAKFDQKWLYLLLSSPAIAGVLKGLWDTQKSQPLTEGAIVQLQEAVNLHINSLPKKSYLWGDALRQMIPMPGFSSLSERVQSAEQQVRWDGRITNAQRAMLFSNIERLALQGSGLSKINAMQSLAKILHSLSIKDFRRLQAAGYSRETLVQILRIKTQALNDLKILSKCARLQPMQEMQNSTTVVQKSLVSMVYATYLLWWLGMGECKYSPMIWSFKLGKLALEGLFLKAVTESILEAIKCPDKKYFSLRAGDYEVRANDLTPDCFKEFVRQFRFLSKEESFESFLAQLNNFDFTEIESIDLSYKALTSNETIKILNILKNKNSPIKKLNLEGNRINETLELSFPHSLQFLDLSGNSIGDEGAKGLQLPPLLQSLNLWFNRIGDEGAKGLQLPSSLQSLFLGSNNIETGGAKGLQLPPLLQSLNLWFNRIGDEGAKGLQLPSSLQSLDLQSNNISADGAKGLQLPPLLQSLDLRFNRIGDEGAKGLQLPPSLKFLDLTSNNISDEGAKGLRFPSSLQSLVLMDNGIGDEGVNGLQLPPSLQSLVLSYNRISGESIKGLQLPPSLQSLDLSNNNIGAKGAKELQLPLSLRALDLSTNSIGAEGALELQLPPSLQSLSLMLNNISDEGAKGLQLPSALLSLALMDNSIGDEGAKGLHLPPLLQSLDLTSNSISDEGGKGLRLPSALLSLALMDNSIGDEGAKGLQLPPLLQSLMLNYNKIGDGGAKGLQLPPLLQSLGLSDNNIGAEGAKGLQLPLYLQSLDLISNSISAEGAQGLKLPSSLQFLALMGNRIGAAGAQGLQLPPLLQSLDLRSNNISAAGAKGLQLPLYLQSLDLNSNSIGDEGAKGLQLPSSLQFLYLRWNCIGNEGVNALLQKIPKTNLTTIDLDYNLYNSTAINLDRIIQQKRQQQALLKNCQDKLCYADTSLSQDAYQTSGATRVLPPLFFSWLKKPFDKLAEYASGCLSETLSSLGARLEQVVSHSPCYFPNIRSPEVNDWQPSGSVMVHQFKTGGSNTLLLPAPQIAQLSLSTIAR